MAATLRRMTEGYITEVTKRKKTKISVYLLENICILIREYQNINDPFHKERSHFYCIYIVMTMIIDYVFTIG